MLKKAILNFLTRDVDAIVAFIHSLEARLAAFIAKHQNEIDALKADIAEVEAEAAKRVSEIETEIGNKVRAAEVVLGLKKALPTA